jgi:hypothetical protein
MLSSQKISRNSIRSLIHILLEICAVVVRFSGAVSLHAPPSEWLEK